MDKVYIFWKNGSVSAETRETVMSMLQNKFLRREILRTEELIRGS